MEEPREIWVYFNKYRPDLVEWVASEEPRSEPGKHAVKYIRADAVYLSDATCYGEDILGKWSAEAIQSQIRREFESVPDDDLADAVVGEMRKFLAMTPEEIAEYNNQTAELLALALKSKKENAE